MPDVSEDPEYTLPAATTIGYRSVLAVPIMHQGVARGSILVARDVVAPFSDKDIALIQTFAEAAASRSPTTTRWSTASGRWASPCESTEQIEEWLMLLDV